jgi:glycosyltransferase involved in cell wall biosynthesis
MRIALISHEYPVETGFGGIGTYTWHQARALARLGHDVHVLAGATAPTGLRSAVDDGVAVHRFWSDDGWMKLFDRLDAQRLWWTKDRLKKALSTWRGFARLLERHAFDVVEMPDCGAEGALVNHLLGVPSIVRFHSPARLIMPHYDVRPEDTALCSLIERVAFDGATAFTACAKFVATEVERVIGVPRPIDVIPNGIDLEHFDRDPVAGARVRHGLPADRPVVLFCGRMEPRKGIQHCLPIVRAILERHAVAFAFAGQDLFGTMRNEILPALAGAKLAGTLHWLGQLDLAAARALMRECDVFFMPSTWEGCPYACLEAMAAGRAIVAADNSGIPELIRDGQDGLLAPLPADATPGPAPIPAMVEALERLLTNETLRAELGRSARRRVEECFTAEAVARRSVDVYRSCASKPVARAGLGGVPEFAPALRALGAIELGAPAAEVAAAVDDGRDQAVQERMLTRLARSRERSRSRRALAAVGTFPSWSQTFVHQQLCDVVEAGFELRIGFVERGPPRELRPEHASIARAGWPLAHVRALGEGDLAHWRREAPAAVDALLADVSRESGLPEREVAAHDDVRSAFTFARVAAAWRPDWLHSFSFDVAGFQAFVASRLLGIPRGITCCTAPLPAGHEQKLVRLQLEQASLVVATSTRIREALLGIAPELDPARLLLVRNGVDGERFPVCVRSEPRPGEPFRLACVGRYEAGKGLLDAVEAVRRLRARGLDVELHLVGEAAPDARSQSHRNDLCAAVTAAKLWGKVHLEGIQDGAGVRRFLSISHLFVAPSVDHSDGDKDGVPTALLEAMATGLASVVTDAGSIREAVAAGVTASIVAQRSPLALAAAIEELLRDPVRRSAMGARAAAAVRTGFDARRSGALLKERLLELTRRP